MNATQKVTAMLLVLVALALTGMAALGATNSTNGTAPAPAAPGIPGIVMAVIGGVVSGLIYAGTSYAVSHAASEDFDPAKFVQPLVMGAVIGGLSSYLGLDYAATQAYVNSLGLNIALVTIVDKVAKAIIRHLPQKGTVTVTETPAPEAPPVEPEKKD